MSLGVRQAEGAAQDMAELVVQRHPDRAEAGPAEPGAAEGTRAGGHVAGVADEGGQGPGKR
ncbi:hypothetical protein Mnod_0747 [Methylobacterium nodulans ORS 2060]|uniref:Uncharacterized protein n=1 Tax=Methylobacterium nodulans (strain LMG 21967 / CNCM I-2342 / ORS 2060) TaxID=460265 RepID=B8IF68_METNO|nr:hypothetical protein Mnod_0747 [Methylobacterium nodulans ORS 2060]